MQLKPDTLGIRRNKPEDTQITVAQYYRGPAVMREDSCVYTNQSAGTLEMFWGYERNTDCTQPVYALHYNRGVLR
jgi:hypothetical protein